MIRYFSGSTAFGRLSRLFYALVLLFASATACDRSVSQSTMSTPTPPLRLNAPDPEFHLDPVQVKELQPGFDVEALERLLSLVHPAYRSELLAGFKQPPPGQPVPNVYRIEDPILQPLLDEVWTPRWSSVGEYRPAEPDVARGSARLPGQSRHAANPDVP